ncbi:Polysaccharide monooxygenase Cel61a [Paramyrothecium foliicola]|nr:Polysaccharide monooxygenase Cel61a [Paramyrothecium foliicola]
MKNLTWAGCAACILALGTSASVIPKSSAKRAAECVAATAGGPVVITADCIDPAYSSPIFDKATDETSPVPHHRISGHFNGTGIDFNIYLTPKEQWEGRFFQLLYPSQTSVAEDYAIVFGVESGGYTIQASGSIGYRADAALAKLSRSVAREYYGNSSSHIYGYTYGGSGGSLKAIGAAEQTVGVWDGCVALIQATPMSIPYNWGIRALGAFVLAGHKDQLIDSIRPGGSGYPYPVLPELEQAILRETTALGVPVEGWEDWGAIAENNTQLYQTLQEITVPMIRGNDPTYVDDFWTKDGYAGADKTELGERFRAALVQFDSDIESVAVGNDNLTSEFVLENVPEGVADVIGFGFSMKINSATHYFDGKLDVKTRAVHIQAGADSATLESLVPGANVQVDNRWYLSTYTFHRHQVPPVESGFYGFDYLRDEAGNPLYPQRNVVQGPLIARSTTGGATHSGNLTMKMILMNTLLDFDAFPWHADWYKNQVLEAKGSLDDHFRLYYGDNADHLMSRLEAPQTSRVVEFIGMYEQHLRDLSAWVERGVSPPPPTNYTVKDGRVEVPKCASKRQGIQPIVNLAVNGSKRIQIRPGDSVEFVVIVQVPSGTGQVVSLEFDPAGVGAFTKVDHDVADEVYLQFSHTFTEPGEYFAGVRAASHREGRTDTDAALAWNMDRALVARASCLNKTAAFILDCRLLRLNRFASSNPQDKRRTTLKPQQTRFRPATMAGEVLASFAGAIQASLSVLLTIFYGVIAAQTEFLDERAAKKISKLCVNMLLPALLIVNLGTELDANNITRYLPVLAWALFYNIVSWLIGALGTRLLNLPKWVTPAVTFNNTTSMPLLLIQSLGSTGVLGQLAWHDSDDSDTIVQRARSYFLVASIIGNTMTFGLGGEMLGAYEEDPADELDQHLRDRSSEDASENEDYNNEQDPDEVTSLLPTRVNRGKKKAVNSTYKALTKVWDTFPSWLQTVVARIFKFLSPPGIGALVGIFLGITPPLHRIFFNDATEGGYFKAWLTTSLKNIGELFVALQVIVVGVKLAVSLRRMRQGESAGKLPPLAVTFTLLVRLLVWPIVSIAIIWALAAKTNVLGDDPVLWFTMMLMPTGPSAMKLGALADVGGAGDEEKMAIAKFLTIKQSSQLYLVPFHPYNFFANMHSFAVLLGLAACLPQMVSAHGFVRQVNVNGVWTSGSDPVWFYHPAGQGPKTAGWDSLNQDLGFVEPAQFQSTDIACHKSAKVGANFINVNAGQTMTLYWNTWPESHKGPIINYIAPFQSSAGNLRFSKISQAAIVSGQTWVTDNLIRNNFTSTVTIPRNLKAGDYVLRHEIIALHGAGNDNGAQAYPQCLNLRVGGSGTVSPSGGTPGTSLYTRSTPGIIFNLYGSYTSYPYPGPALWTAAN